MSDSGMIEGAGWGAGAGAGAGSGAGWEEIKLSQVTKFDP